MVLGGPGKALELTEVVAPLPGPGQIRIAVKACGVCRTDLHLMDGELSMADYPVIPGHQIVGVVEKIGTEVEGMEEGDRVGIPWLGGTCDKCDYCANGRENLCRRAKFTGCSLDGGFAEYAVADARYCFPIHSQNRVGWYREPSFVRACGGGRDIARAR